MISVVERVFPVLTRAVINMTTVQMEISALHKIGYLVKRHLYIEM